MRYFLLIDIGGTRLRAAVGNDQGKILSRKETSTKVEDKSQGVLNQLFTLCDEVMAMLPFDPSQIERIGISFGGPVDYANQRIIKSQHIAGWEDFPLCALMTEKYGIPAIIDNDANVAALGEKVFGSGVNINNFLYLTVSTGIGGAIVLDGKLLHGKNNLAGEVGHMIIVENGNPCECGKSGCLEAYSSGTAIAKTARTLINNQPQEISGYLKSMEKNAEQITAEKLFQEASSGDSMAATIIENAIKHLGIGIGNIISLLDLEMVIIGGGITNAKEQFFNPLQTYMDNFSMFKEQYHVPVKTAENQEDTGLIGSIALVLRDSDVRNLDQQIAY